MAKRLRDFWQNAKPFQHPFLAAETAEALRQQMSTTPDPTKRIELEAQYALWLQRAGQPEEAFKTFQQYGRDREANHHPLLFNSEARLLIQEAVCQLRIGELANCLSGHNADSCLIPIRGAGVHRDQAGARAAIALLAQALDDDPDNLEAGWLLNIAYMTVGEYPDHVPSHYLIPPRVFASEYDIKRFPDVAVAMGLDIDSLAGSVVMEDFDGDGFLDLMISDWGKDGWIRVFRNNGDGTFTERTNEAGLAGLSGGLQMISTDYNNDGHLDVLVLRGGWLNEGGLVPCSLLRNNGDFTFTDVTEEAGLGQHLAPTQTAAWIDYDGDGWVDLFIGNESTDKVNAPCELYHNNHDGTFTECAAANGLNLVAFVKGVTMADYNNDGRPDLYLSVRNAPNILLRNDGPATAKSRDGQPWKFTDVAATARVTEPIYSFPCWFFDYDNDGWPDLMVFGYHIQSVADVAADYLGADSPGTKAKLYHNNHDGTFSDVSAAMGVSKVLLAMGCDFGDLDNDGWLDFYVGTGDPGVGTLIPNRMFRNDGGKRFQDVTTSGDFGQLQKGHTIAFGDLNNDGDQDIFSVVGGAYPGDNYHKQLFANPGHGNHWIKLTLEGTTDNRAAIGAKIKVTVMENGRQRSIYRFVGSRSSFGGSPLRQEIGLGQATSIVQVEVYWPVAKKTQAINGLERDAAYRINEDQPNAEKLPMTTFAFPDPFAPPPKPHVHHHVASSGGT